MGELAASGSRLWTRFLATESDDALDFRFASAHRDQSVLVTGAGGFIGSALVRTIATAGPKRMVLLDSAEQNLFQVQQQLESMSGHAASELVLGSVNDADLLDDIFTQFQPEIIYHAAAFKHVPLMERHPLAVVCNNTIGTYTLAQTALRHGTPKLILISTDKAVNPHSLMGVSKRLAELVVVAASSPGYRMNAIRLGNVIGSTGSVVPIFLRQIADRRPVTITHRDATRWFMSLNQAVAAVLASGAADIEGRILVPELGAPVRITDLATFLIGEAAEIPIVFTGCRPGDKLVEELASKAETREGAIPGLLQLGSLEVFKTQRLDQVQLRKIIMRLSDCIASRDVHELVRTLCSAVPEYVPSELLRDQCGSQRFARQI